MLKFSRQHTKSTLDFNIKQIESGNIEFWTIEEDQNLIGELYLFKKLEDTDFADGVNRAIFARFVS